MKTLRAIVGLMACCLAAGAQGQAPGYRFEWVRTNSGPEHGDSGVDLAVDADSSIFVVGHHSGLDLDRDGTVDVATRGSTDGLVVRSRPDGVGIWLESFGGPQFDRGTGNAIDGSGGAWSVGSFRDSIQFGEHAIRSKGPYDGYIIRHSRDGDVIRAWAVGGDGDDTLTDVATDSAGNVYVTGTIRGPVDLDGSGTVDATAGTQGAALLASFRADGTLRWAWTPAGQAESFGWAVHVDAKGGVFVGGTYRNGQLDLNRDGRPDTPVATNESDGFLARFDNGGDLRWMRALSGPDPEMVRSITQAENGDLLVAGGIYGATDFDGDGSPDARVARGERKSFLARYTYEGRLVWVRVYGPETAWHVTAHRDRLALTGLYKGALDFDGDGTVDGRAAADGESEGFTAILDAEGRLRHLFTIVGPGADQARAAGFSPDGRKLFSTGFVRLTADFDGDGVPEGGVRCDELGDMFIAGYHLGP
jgi:hypothetical protein